MQATWEDDLTLSESARRNLKGAAVESLRRAAVSLEDDDYGNAADFISCAITHTATSLEGKPEWQKDFISICHRVLNSEVPGYEDR